LPLPSALEQLGSPTDPLTSSDAVGLRHADGDALDAAINAYLQARTPPPSAEPEAEKGMVRR
jgi:hypothetical protein